MIGLGLLSFAEPWLLLALAALPAIVLLARLTPPAPRRQVFPAIRLLFGLRAAERTPARSPWWLLLVRLSLATSIVLALARPLLNPQTAIPGSGPVILALDDGWAAAARWSERQQQALTLLDRAERQGRAVALLLTAPGENGEAPHMLGPRPAADLRAVVQALTPKPWPSDRAAALAALHSLAPSASAPAFWIADGLEDRAFLPLAEKLQRGGGLTLIAPLAHQLPLLLLPPDHAADAVHVSARRLIAGLEQPVLLRAEAFDGRLLAESKTSFASSDTAAAARFVLPIELRNAIARFRIEGQDHAGAVMLLDSGFQRKTVGIVAQDRLDSSHSLLQDEYYLDRALRPFVQLRRGSVSELTFAPPSTLLLTDDQVLSDADRTALLAFIEKGGALIRFAGSALAERETSSALLPVTLRQGGRQLGTILQWSEPQKLAEFAAGSPLAGLAIPQDIVVHRQLLAEPDAALAARSWARLADGTPLVTADRRGRGWLVLVHVPASAEWSSLPLSGCFVEMLQRFADLGQEWNAGPPPSRLPPERMLDGFGRLTAPSATAHPLPAELPLVSPQHPPGYYGDDRQRRALNLTASLTDLTALTRLPPGIVSHSFALEREIDLMPWLWLAALGLFLVDFVLSIGMRYSGYGKIRPLLLLMLFAGQAGQAEAADERAFALKASRDTRLAAVLTGDVELDRISLAGLRELSRVLSQRTAVEPLEPMVVDIEQDELAFFPLLYWPIGDRQAPLSRQATEKLNRYLHRGGAVLFDTRDGDSRAFSLTGRGSNASALRRLLQEVDIPPLIPLTRDHVLNRSFYLLADFPGRFVEGELWLQGADSGGDDVASVIIGANDYAAAWAGDRLSGITPQQREQALRFGVNLTMYVLTGNYKADQIHAPAILERLGQ